MGATRILIVGCGVMGRSIARAVLGKETLTLVGAVDLDASLIGRDIGELTELSRETGVPVTRPEDAEFGRADCCIVTTGSRLSEVEEQITRCVAAGTNVVSTCEELAYPWLRNPDIAARLDRLAQEQGVTVVGTGINPGFLMDTLPVVLSAPCLTVEHVQVTRMMNSARRRIPFQRKVGTGLSPEAFAAKIASGEISGHVGLTESMQMIAAGLGWELAEYVEEPPEPVVAGSEVETGLGAVSAGRVVGLTSVAWAAGPRTATGAAAGRTERVRLVFSAHAQVEEEYDEIAIDGTPPVRQRIHGGVNGDTGTVAVTVNTAYRAVDAPPGLRTMIEVAPPAAVR